MAGNLVIALFAAPASANNSAPSGAPSESGYGATTVGKPISYGTGYGKVDDWILWIQADSITTLTGRLWLYGGDLRNPADPNTQRHVWAPAGVGTDADKGKINGGQAIATATHVERFEGLGPIDGAQLQLTGTFSNLLAWLVGVPRRP